MSNPGKKTAEDDEVEQLLRAAQDEMLLKLSLNSHVTRGGSAAIDPDLDRRFEALRKPQKPAKFDGATKKAPAKTDSGSASNPSGAAVDDDLFARFAALKCSIPSHNMSEQKISFRSDVPVNQEMNEEEESEDEVEKVIQWAIDAARLDPSPPSEDDDDDTNDDDSDDDDDVSKRKKGERK